LKHDFTEREFLHERPLPETPSSDEVSNSSDASESDDLEDEEGDDNITETKDIPSNGSTVHHNNHIPPIVESNCSSKYEDYIVFFCTITYLLFSMHRTNGVDTTSEENTTRRRVQNDALREKIREIKAHQKESEAMKGIYRSIPPKYLFYFLMFGVGAFSLYYYRSS
jgi:hypothetical protein